MGEHPPKTLMLRAAKGADLLPMLLDRAACWYPGGSERARKVESLREVLLPILPGGPGAADNEEIKRSLCSAQSILEQLMVPDYPSPEAAWHADQIRKHQARRLASAKEGMAAEIATEMQVPSIPDPERSENIVLKSEAKQIHSAGLPAPLPDNGKDSKRRKRSTERGEARAKIIAALTEHHHYSHGGCLKQEPIGVNELARAAEVSASSTSGFFNSEFKGYKKYRVVCRDPGRLADSLKALNGEFSPHDLYGRRPPGEDDRDDGGDE
jgi:hypothetical protein